MTQNQIAARNAAETVRHNLETERLTSEAQSELARHNVVSEREIWRHNMVGESLTADSNTITNLHNLRMDYENARHNLANETEVNRHNEEEESIKQETNRIQNYNVMASSAAREDENEIKRRENELKEESNAIASKNAETSRKQMISQSHLNQANIRKTNREADMSYWNSATTGLMNLGRGFNYLMDGLNILN